MFPCSQQLKTADVNVEWQRYDVRTMFGVSKTPLRINSLITGLISCLTVANTPAGIIGCGTGGGGIGAFGPVVHAYVGTVVTAVSVLVVRRAELVVGITPAIVLAAVPEVEIVAVAVTVVALLAGVALLLLLSFGKALLVPAIELVFGAPKVMVDEAATGVMAEELTFCELFGKSVAVADGVDVLTETAVALVIAFSKVGVVTFCDCRLEMISEMLLKI
uniref:Uncharacterized protein n=1 Tax=Glossina pallidipes TaxID=7398 RepID=A0A1B0ABC4_GLOPL